MLAITCLRLCKDHAKSSCSTVTIICLAIKHDDLKVQKVRISQLFPFQDWWFCVFKLEIHLNSSFRPEYSTQNSALAIKKPPAVAVIPYFITFDHFFLISQSTQSAVRLPFADIPISMTHKCVLQFLHLKLRQSSKSWSMLSKPKPNWDITNRSMNVM
jgi:hypothetical protein